MVGGADPGSVGSGTGGFEIGGVVPVAVLRMRGGAVSGAEFLGWFGKVIKWPDCQALAASTVSAKPLATRRDYSHSVRRERELRRKVFLARCRKIVTTENRHVSPGWRRESKSAKSDKSRSRCIRSRTRTILTLSRTANGPPSRCRSCSSAQIPNCRGDIAIA